MAPTPQKGALRLGIGTLAEHPRPTRLKAFLSPVRVGASQQGSHFMGTFDELAIYSKALAPHRILAHYEAAE